MTLVSRNEKEQVVAQLRARRDRGERLPSSTIENAARLLGVGKSTVWRWISNGVPEGSGRPPTVQITDEIRDLVVQCHGSPTAMAKELGNQGVTVSRWALSRAMKRELSPQFLAGAKGGEMAMRAKQLGVQLQTAYRNQCWQADCSELPIHVIMPTQFKDQKAWITTFIDCHTRAVMGYAVSVHSTDRGSVLAALGNAISLDKDRGPFCGVPEQLVYDGGKPYLSDVVTQAELRLSISATVCDPYHPEQKGKVERWFRTLKQDLIKTLPFALDGPKRANGEPYANDEVQKLHYNELRAKLDDWCLHYNLERPHSALGGRTPLEAWNEDSHAIRHASDEELIFACTEAAERKVQKMGISFKNRYYTAPELSGLVGEKVTIRYFPNDDRSLQVFSGDVWLCRAVPQDALTDDEILSIKNGRAEASKELGRSRRKNNRKARAKLLPATPGKPVEVGGIALREEVAGDLDAAAEGRLAKEAKEMPLTDASPNADDVWDPEGEQ